VKVAIATDGGHVAQHFGRCPEYTFFEVEDGEVKSRMVVPNPGHQPGFLPGYLARLGVSCIIAGGMGPRAQALFADNNIETVTGVTGRVDDVIDDYAGGTLSGGESLCEHPDGAGCDRDGGR